MRALVTAAAAAVWLAGCQLPDPYSSTPAPGPAPVPSTAPTPLPPPTPLPGQGPVVVPSEPRPAPAPVTRQFRLGPATQSLVAQAQQQSAKGDLDAASATLDRAIRIEPRNPLLWIELAKLRLAQTQAKQAESYGRKALALAAGDRRAQSQANRVIADSLKAQGRNVEARAFETSAVSSRSP